MQGGPVQTLRIASVAARRALSHDLLFAGGRALALTCGLALAVIGAGKLGVSVPGWPVVIGAAAGAGLIGAGVWGFARRWSAPRATRELDQRLGLKSRLSTAVALSGAPADPFNDWAVAEAERIAPTVRVAQAVPVRADWMWGLWPLLAAGAIAVALFVPAMPTRHPPVRPEPTPAERAQAAAQVRQTADAIRQGLAADRVQQANPAQLKALEELERELAQGRVDPQQGAVQAAKQVEDLAQRLESDAAAAQKRADDLREQLAKGAGKESGVEPSPLMRAVEQGDIRTAAEELAKAAANEPKLTAAERERLARDMEQLAQAIEADKQDSRDAAGTPAGSETPKPTEQSERGGQDKPQSPPGAVETPPKSDAPAPTQADRPQSPSPQAPNHEREALREALRDAAKELREEAPAEPQDHQSPKERPDQSKPRTEDLKGDAGGETGATGTSGQTGTTGEPSASGAQGASGDQKGRPRTEPGEPSGAKAPDRPRRGDQKSPSEGEQGATGQKRPTNGQRAPGESTPSESGNSGPAGDRPSSGQQPGTGSEQGAPKESQRGQAPNQVSQPRPGAEPGATGSTPGTGQLGASGASSSPGATGQAGASGASSAPATGPGEGQPAPTASPGGLPRGNAPESGDKSPSGLDRAAKELKRLTDGSGDPKRARELRNLERKMLEQASPEQREQYRKMAEEFAREYGGGGPGSQPAPLASRPPQPLRDGPVAPIDARRPATVSGNDKPPERTVAEWYSDNKPDEPGALEARPAEVFRQAADGAERAIENQQVPGRYQDLVRRVFRRYAEQAPK